MASDDDPMLDAILNDVIEIQEKSPPLTGSGQPRTTICHHPVIKRNRVGRNGSSNSPTSAAILTEHSQISDIEKYLASAENTPPRENSPPQNISVLPRDVQTATHAKSASSVASCSPSLTSILSAPPISAVPRNILNGSSPKLPSTGVTAVSMSAASVPNRINNGVGNGDDSAALVPRMNELLQVVPPNVSIPDCPDLNSLIHLQNADQENRRRRLSSGGGATAAVNATDHQSSIRQGWSTLQQQLPSQPSPRGMQSQASSTAITSPLPLALQSPQSTTAPPNTLGNMLGKGKVLLL